MQEDARVGKSTVVGSQTVILQINPLEKLKGARGRPKNNWQQSEKKGESGRPQLATGAERSTKQNRRYKKRVVDYQLLLLLFLRDFFLIMTSGFGNSY